MQTQVHVQQRMSSLAASVQQWVSSVERKVTSRGKQINLSRVPLRQFHEMISALGVVLGALAFGFWWKSIGAALFACFPLFFLAGIYRAMEGVVAAVRRWEREGLEIAPTARCNREGTVKAMQRLQPWVAGETSLAEEDAKEFCAALLKTVQVIHPEAGAQNSAAHRHCSAP